MSFEAITCKTDKGSYTCEMIRRLTKNESGSLSDGVEVIPIVYYPKSNKPNCLLIIQQFRVPINAKVWQFPTGIIDSGETPDVSAIRELKEETGFIAEKVLHVNKRIASCPDIADTYVQSVTVLINGDDEINQNPIQDLGPSEDIAPVLVPLNELEKFIMEKVNKGESVFDNLFCLSQSAFLLDY